MTYENFERDGKFCCKVSSKDGSCCMVKTFNTEEEREGFIRQLFPVVLAEFEVGV